MEVKGLVANVYREVAVDTLDRISDGRLKVAPVRCRYCGSVDISKYGHNRKHVQRFLCNACKRVFLDTDNLPYMRLSVKELGDILGQYYGGMSLKELRRQFQQQHGKALARSSFDRWRDRFSRVAVAEASKHHPKVGDTWIADECVLKIGGRKVWCWDAIDSDTRFLLATHLSPTRTIKDARILMEKAARVAGKAPKVILTDSLSAYIDGIELTFGGETKHIRSKPFAETDLSTNKIERWHSTLKTRTDVMRGLKSLGTAQNLLDAWLVHYNYFRPHESLEDRSPGETAGSLFPYKDWLDVVEGQRLIVVPVENGIGKSPLIDVNKPHQKERTRSHKHGKPRRHYTRQATTPIIQMRR